MLRRRQYAAIGAFAVFGLVLFGIWFFGTDHYVSTEGPEGQAAQLPPPEKIRINDRGVQEFTLVITPGGYKPMRFAVKKGVPVRMTFRQLGEVGCGNVLIFPTASSQGTAGLTLKNENDKRVLEFTPDQVGDFQFYCSHFMYGGIMTVYEAVLFVPTANL